MSDAPEYFERNRYIAVQGFLSKSMCQLATQYAYFSQLRDFRPEGPGMQVPGTHSVYGDPLMEALLLKLHPGMELHTGLKLCPTYSYYRVYKAGDSLPRHKDREACEVSATLNLGWNYLEQDKDYRWPVWVGDSDGAEGSEGRSFKQNAGDAVIYRGCEIEHWRETFDVKPGSFHVQVFLHYIDANGPYVKDHLYDQRPGLGYLAQTERGS